MSTSDKTFAPAECLLRIACVALLMVVGCTAQISGEPDSGDNPPAAPPNGTDPGRIAIHRLNNLEYANTIRDLVGVTVDTSNFFSQDGKGDSFDNIASEFVVNDSQYQDFYNAAVDASERAFADPIAAGRILTCVPASATDTACFKTILQSWGLKAWRRPLSEKEIADLTKLGTDAITGGETPAGGVKQVVRTMLVSPYFLYRIELDPDPSSTKPHPLTGYELASRLSYLHWSSMPDVTLFNLAASGEITKDATLTGQVDRMLADDKGQAFVSRFAGQWLGMDKLLTHNVFATAFPKFTDPVKQAMYKEGLLYFRDFLLGSSRMKDFFTAKVNFVDGTLAGIYGVQGITGDTPERLTNVSPNREGFMGLASFLTLSSNEYRTAPTLRGKWVQENLLCQTIPMPPNAAVAKLEDSADPKAVMMAQTENIAMRLAAHRTMPDCAACHSILDPIGLGLENYDGIGVYRTTYANGDEIDASGTFDMKTFSGLDELARILSNPQDKYLGELTECATKKLMIYSLSRIINPGDTDDPYVKRIAFEWGGGSMKDLLKKIVLSAPFRSRHGEPSM